jgi:hypothetical protein
VEGAEVVEVTAAADLLPELLEEIVMELAALAELLML